MIHLSFLSAHLGRSTVFTFCESLIYAVNSFHFLRLFTYAVTVSKISELFSSCHTTDAGVVAPLLQELSTLEHAPRHWSAIIQNFFLWVAHRVLRQAVGLDVEADNWGCASRPLLWTRKMHRCVTTRILQREMFVRCDTKETA